MTTYNSKTKVRLRAWQDAQGTFAGSVLNQFDSGELTQTSRNNIQQIVIPAASVSLGWSFNLTSVQVAYNSVTIFNTDQTEAVFATYSLTASYPPGPTVLTNQTQMLVAAPNDFARAYLGSVNTLAMQVNASRNLFIFSAAPVTGDCIIILS